MKSQELYMEIPHMTDRSTTMVKDACSSRMQIHDLSKFLETEMGGSFESYQQQMSLLPAKKEQSITDLLSLRWLWITYGLYRSLFYGKKVAGKALCNSVVT